MSKVLVVEDEVTIRWLAMDFVSEAGLEALEAEDADRALSILEECGDIDIVFTDVRMPGPLDGLELARVIRTRWPQTRIMVGSGHVSAELASAAGADRVFAKPYQAGAVIDALQELSRSVAR